MFHGRRMVGVAFGAHLIAGGLGFYGLPRLLVPLAEEFSGGDRAGVALLTAAMSLPGIVIGPLVGRALTRFPLRTMMPLGALVFAAGFVLASRAETLWQLGLVYATTVPVAVAALSSVGGNALVGNWFVRGRAMALGVSQLGMSLAGAVMTFFISWTLVGGGWRGTYLWFAAVALVCAGALRWTVIDHPAERGQRPDGDAAPPGADANAPAPRPTLTFSAALRDPALWWVASAAGIAFSATTGLMQNAHALATDAGYDVPRADTTLAVIALGAALGKLVFGWLGVRIGERATFAVALIAQAAMMFALPSCLARFPALLAAAFAAGVALGGVMPALSALLARIYGPAGFGPVLGYMAPVLIPFQMLGAPIAAAVRDRTGSYDPALYGFALATAVAALALVPLRLPAPDAAPLSAGSRRA